MLKRGPEAVGPSPYFRTRKTVFLKIKDSIFIIGGGHIRKLYEVRRANSSYAIWVRQSTLRSMDMKCGETRRTQTHSLHRE